MLNNSTLIRLSDLIQELNVGKTTIWRWVNEGLFPEPITLGPRTTAWETAAVNEWLEAKKVKRNG